MLLGTTCSDPGIVLQCQVHKQLPASRAGPWLAAQEHCQGTKAYMMKDYAAVEAKTGGQPRRYPVQHT